MNIVAIYPVGSADTTDGISTKPVVDFIVESLTANSIEPHIISPRLVSGDEPSLQEGRITIENGGVVTFPFSLKNRGTTRPRGLGLIRLWWWLIKTILTNTKPGERVIVYHSMRYIVPVYLLQLFGRIRVILYVGEFFQTLYPMRRWKRRLENSYIKGADAYILVTQLLVDQVEQLRTKPFDYAVLYGPYVREQSLVQEKEYVEIIRLLYVGKISKDKGIERTLQLAQYLDDRFEIRILGYCESYDEEFLRTTIAESNATHRCKITFDGLKHGIEYKMYVQSCDLGLVLQDMDASYNANSFPSKILSFISNGLEVLAPAIPTIATSPLAHSLYLYEDEAPEAIAQTIRDIDFTQRRSNPGVLDNLKNTFIEELRSLIKSQQT